MTTLTPKEEAFARAVAAGASLSDAYRSSRDCAKMATSTINANAKKLGRKPAIKARIEELQRESKNPEFSRNIARAGAHEGRESSDLPGPNAASGPAPDPVAKAEESPNAPLKEPRPTGRPTVYGEDLAAAILARLAAGRPLRTICRDNGMPAESTVRGWTVDPNHPFAARYALAREIGFYSMADEILEIADDSRNDWLDKVTRSGETVRVVDEEAIARSRVRIAARQWLLGKALPQAFGDRLEHSGGLKLEDVTPRPQHPGRDVLEDDLRKFREAVRHHHARIAAEEAVTLPLARAKSNGRAEH